MSLGLGIRRKACTPVALGVMSPGGSPRRPACPFIPSHSSTEKGSVTAATVLGGSSWRWRWAAGFPPLLFEAKAASSAELFPPLKKKPSLAAFASYEQEPSRAPHPSAPRRAARGPRGLSRAPCLAPSWLLRAFQMFGPSRCSAALPPDGDVSAGLVSCSGSRLTARGDARAGLRQPPPPAGTAGDRP